MLRIAVDSEKCCGAGTCVLIAPEVFDQTDDEGLAFVVCGEPDPEQADSVHEAALACPRGAITVTEED
ncbi:ferredoxin [Streptomyces sp. JHA26]|uniref:ferredoxin n=1 Tax=Streptomyces sp. JHA26 TaxID=1917143 RepID=UPI00098BB9AC|nr:ferredoxin [Streptomyces sp. JHA26]